ncbi:unnamed protein product, partial [Sphacelaria rigidula]
PVATKQRRFSPAETEAIQAEVEKLYLRGIIRRSESEWAARSLAVPKKDGALRLCHDYRELNDLTETDSGGLGDIESMHDRLSGNKYISTSDLASGYFQLEIEENDKHKTAFRDALGQLWEYNRCSFGLKNLPSGFTRGISKTLGSIIGKGVQVWLDDILIFSKTLSEHLYLIRKVISGLLEAKHSVNFAKSSWCMPNQEFLGMAIDREERRSAPSKIEAFSKLSPSNTVKELRAFLGMTGYMPSFVDHYSIIAAPLTDVPRDPRFQSKRARKLKIPWDDGKQQAFEKLKEALISPPVQAYPLWEHPFPLHTDASILGASAKLCQTIDGAEKVVAYASHRFSRTDSLRAATHRECMAALWATGHFRQYITGRRFDLVTDCSALLWLLRSRDLEPKLHRWALRLMEYDMTLR